MKGILSNFKPGLLPIINTGTSHYPIAPDPMYYEWLHHTPTIYEDDKVIAPLELGTWDD
jgi:hypothetical protein